MKRVFLGGTCNGSEWRQTLISKLDPKKVSYFNPVVEDWTPECMEREIQEREICDVCLYVITPKMTGVYSIAEVIDDSNKRPLKTIFAYIPADGDKGFEEFQIKSLKQVGKMVLNNQGRAFDSLDQIAEYLNNL